MGGTRDENFASLVHKRGSVIARRRRRYIRPSRNKLPVHRINGNITAEEVRLIDSSGTNRGSTAVSEALAIAEAVNLDLVDLTLVNLILANLDTMSCLSIFFENKSNFGPTLDDCNFFEILELKEKMLV